MVEKEVLDEKVIKESLHGIETRLGKIESRLGKIEYKIAEGVNDTALCVLGSFGVAVGLASYGMGIYYDNNLSFSGFFVFLGGIFILAAGVPYIKNVTSNKKRMLLSACLALFIAMLILILSSFNVI